MVKNLKKAEKSILKELEIDGRIPLTQLARKIKTSQQRVSYMINSFTQKGIIRGFYTLIDYSMLGALSFRVYFKLSYISEQKLDELTEYLNTDSHTAWVAACGGRYDLICSFFTPNPSQFNKTLRAIRSKFPHQLQNYSVLTTVVIRYYGRKYLVADSHLSEKIIGGDRQPQNLDMADLRILAELAERARTSSVEIANKIGVSPKTVINKIRRLREGRVLRGFSPLYDFRTIGSASALLLVRYHNVSSQMENKLIQYLKTHPNVLSVVKTLGEWDVEIELEVQGTVKRREIERKIRTKFALIIKDIETIPLYVSSKKNFFPRYLIDQ